MAKAEKTDLVVRDETALLTVDEVWVKQREMIMKLYAPDCNTNEAEVFFALGRSLGADPRKGEIYPTVYSKNDPSKRKMSIVMTRDFRLRKAEEQPTYNGHWAVPVYEKDDLSVETVESEDGDDYLRYTFRAKPNSTDRGELIGALAKCSVKNRKHPHQEFILFRDFDKGQAMWTKDRGMPSVMIAKCAEAMVLKKAFVGVFGGTYTEDEMVMAGLIVNQTPAGNFGGKGMAVAEVAAEPVKQIEAQPQQPEVIVEKPKPEPAPVPKVIESTAKPVIKADEPPLTIEEVMKWAISDVGVPLPAFKHCTKGLTPKDAACKIATNYRTKNPFAHLS